MRRANLAARPLVLEIPRLSLVVLVGPSGSGKSTFAARHFRETEVLSSDRLRAMVADDENDQSATGAAFELLHLIGEKRLTRGRLTVIDATNVRASARRPLLELARRQHVPPVAIVFALPAELLEERRKARRDRTIAEDAVARQAEQLESSLPRLVEEGFERVLVLRTPEEVARAEVRRVPLPGDLRHLRGPFDIIGDVHGCLDELVALLRELGYRVEEAGGGAGARERAALRVPAAVVTPPRGRMAVFVGDLVDRGPDTPGVLRLVMDMVAAGTALCLPGNHDDKLRRALSGGRVQVEHGLERSLEQLERHPDEFRERVVGFIEGLPSQLVLDGGRLLVAHAGMKQKLQGRWGKRVRDFALYGDTTGEVDEFGLPVRRNWAAEYRGRRLVIYGHTPVLEPVWLNRTINIDTGCVFGGRLTALRYPELELVSVPAARQYAFPGRPIREAAEFVGGAPADD